MADTLVILVTGASSGIGHAIVEALAGEGYIVYGTSRRAVFPEAEAQGVPMIPLDVTDQMSIDRAVSYVQKRHGRLDVLVNNAGFGVAGSVEDTSPEEAYGQFDTNFFGVHRLIRAVLPIMRGQGGGLIVTVGSVAGILTVPYQGLYSASKHALEALVEAVRMECRPFGIRAVLVEPGDTRTGFTGHRVYCRGAHGHSPYCAGFEKALSTIEHADREAACTGKRSAPGLLSTSFICHPPEKVARVVCRMVRRKNPPVRVMVGGAYKLAAFLKRLVPDRVREWFVSKVY